MDGHFGSLAIKLAVVAEYRSYLDRYKLPELFWVWMLGGERGDGEEYATGCVGRDIPPEEAHRQIQFFAGDLIPQVRQQMHHHLLVPNVIRNPINWAEHFLGKNAQHAGHLKKTEMGLWACKRVHDDLRKMVRSLESDWAMQRMQQTDQLPLWEANPMLHTEDHPPTSWPPDPKHCFPWKRLPMRRPWLLDASPAQRDAWEKDPAVMAGEVKAIGYIGRLVANAAMRVRDEEAPAT